MRLIDGDALIESINAETEKNLCERKTIEELIDNAPTIDAEPVRRGRWIPVTERLPQEETDVLVTRTFLGVIDGNHGWVSHTPPKTYVEVAQYFNGEWTALSDEYKVARSRHTEPVAWMPLPEPYCGAKMEEEE